ncbi:hypothetical protein EUX98_g3686 [Antrodiella citrinella]|uniref:BTB domain-containing protein n=1 Tax=Antrodiella citrinella TaxID=2447956 RepID=A0A4S4MVY1_9APHY|nr:hypothetical protein EUX98_g3686 [Antrodiella citrinella]
MPFNRTMAAPGSREFTGDNADGVVPGIKDASAPFDNPAANLILMEASPFFNDMLSLPVPSGPGKLANPKLKKTRHICDVLEASRNYLMEFVEDKVHKKLICRSKTDPLTMYAFAVNATIEPVLELQQIPSSSLGIHGVSTHSYVHELKVWRTCAEHHVVDPPVSRASVSMIGPSNDTAMVDTWIIDMLKDVKLQFEEEGDSDNEGSDEA